MSPGARSLAAWTGYVMILGAVLLLFPNALLSIFQIEETSEVWIRIVGMLLIALGPYYWTAVRGEFGPMIEASIWVRWAIVVILVVLAFTAGPWQLVLFASVDFLGGLWTYLATRKEPTPTHQPERIEAAG
ncbi:MAG: hypothetical protein U9N56_05310 [Actinomycetota bacterium]|nr:hypothetical protein [Actinomycetota bacterium]